jgi:hypothetical protein
MIEVHEVIERQERGLPYFNWRTIFSLHPAKQMEATSILEDGWTLFGFDLENQVAVFLDVGANADLASAPFSYDEQLNLAKRITAISLDEFNDLAKAIGLAPRIVQLYSIGHCGSTLMHNMFNKVPKVMCISEPKAFFDLAIWRHKLDKPTLNMLAKSALKFVCKYPRISKTEVLVIKHFSQVNTVFASMYEAGNKARNLFLYRDGKSWSNSYYGYAQRAANVGMEIPRDRREFIWNVMSGNFPLSELDGLVDMDAENVTFDSLVAVAWTLHMRDYIVAREAQMPFWAFRYNELKADPLAAMRDALEYCGLDPAYAHLTLSALDHDSHAGTKTAHDIPVTVFSDRNYKTINDIFCRPQVNLDPDLILPHD